MREYDISHVAIISAMCGSPLSIGNVCGASLIEGLMLGSATSRHNGSRLFWSGAFIIHWGWGVMCGRLEHMGTFWYQAWSFLTHIGTHWEHVGNTLEHIGAHRSTLWNMFSTHWLSPSTRWNASLTHRQHVPDTLDTMSDTLERINRT